MQKAKNKERIEDIIIEDLPKKIPIPCQSKILVNAGKTKIYGILTQKGFKYETREKKSTFKKGNIIFEKYSKNFKVSIS